MIHEAALGLPRRTHVPRKIQECKICVEANIKRADIPTQRTRKVTRTLQVVGADLQEFASRSHDGKKYLSIYGDYYSGLLATVSMRNKSEQPEVGLKVIARLERETSKKLVTFRADRGGEYTAKRFQNELKKMGVKMEYSDTDAPFQNGLAERLGGKIVAMMRAAFTRSQVPRKYWPENAEHQTWIHNRVSMRKHDGKTTPIEVASGVKSDLTRARPFGCEVFCRIRRQHKDKLNSKAERGVHLGVSTQSKAWKVLLWKSRKIIETRDCIFFNTEFPFLNNTSHQHKTPSGAGTTRATATICE